MAKVLIALGLDRAVTDHIQAFIDGQKKVERDKLEDIFSQFKVIQQRIKGEYREPEPADRWAKRIHFHESDPETLIRISLMGLIEELKMREMDSDWLLSEKLFLRIRGQLFEQQRMYLKLFQQNYRYIYLESRQYIKKLFINELYRIEQSVCDVINGRSPRGAGPR